MAVFPGVGSEGRGDDSAFRPSDTEPPGPEQGQRRGSHRPHVRATTLAAVVLTIGVTVLIALAARVAYQHNEQRLTDQQTRLSGLLLQTATAQLSAQLDRVAGLSAESSHPASTFQAAMAPLMKPRGTYTSALLVLVDGGAKVVAHRGSKPILDPGGAPAVALYEQSAHSSRLVTTRVVAGGTQRLGFLVSANGPSGTYVVGASQQLPASRHVTLPANSPDSSLDFALYYGTKQSSASLIETNTSSLPIRGTTSAVSVPLGSSRLTLVASPRTTLAGPWSRDLPWAILFLGLILSAAVGLLAEWLARRRSAAESMATLAQVLYDQQREVSRNLQVALLPKALPDVRGVEFSASYIPATTGAEIGGDWYSIIEIDEDHFAFVVGDVSGHGISATATMAPVRFCIRTLALLGMAPSEVFRRADREIDLEEDEHFATVLLGVVDVRTRTVRLASAGHPLPLVLADGHCEQLDLPVGPPLGLHEAPFSEHTLELPAGATLVTFTDGLVEHRGDGIDLGVDRLKQRVKSKPEGSAECTVQQAIAEVVGRDNEDDVAVLVIRFLAESPAQVAKAVETTTVG